MRQIVTIILATVILGCTGGNVKESHTSENLASDSTSQYNGYDMVELFRTRTGHITATINVNGKPCIFLIDTGGGATLIDKSKMRNYGLEAARTGDYAAGIGSVSSLVKTKATFHINDTDIEVKDLFLMDISYINVEFKKNRARQVDGVIGTDFLDRYGALIDYANKKMYLKLE